MATRYDKHLQAKQTGKHVCNNKYGTCRCKQCREQRSNIPGMHQSWRMRRDIRNAKTSYYDTTPRTPRPVEDQFLGPVLGAVSKPATGLSSTPGALSAVTGGAPAKSNIISIGNRQRAALLNLWRQKKQNARTQVVKDRYQKYIDVILKRQRPSWDQSEKDLQHFFKRMGIPGQKTYLGGQPAKWIQRPDGRYVPPGGSVIPDINAADSMIEIKNYNINNQDALIRDLRRQINRRNTEGPKDSSGNALPQRVLLDMRGQQASLNQLKQLAQRVSAQTGLPADNVQVVTWEI